MIPLCDARSQNKKLLEEITDAVIDVVNSGKYINGSHVLEFELEFGEFCGAAPYCCAVSSASAGLCMALLALGVSGEVIIPDMTVGANAEAVILAGCIPVFCDVNDKGQMDVGRLERLINPKKTGAIIAVHMYGTPCDILQIEKIARHSNIKLIEDCAQAHGVTINSIGIGTIGDIGVFSFYPSKPLGAMGDGGAVITNNHYIWERLNAIRDHGRTSDKQRHNLLGFNFRMSDIIAAILSVKLRHLNEWIEARRLIAKRYDEMLPKELIMSCSNNSSNYLYPIVSKNRDELRKKLHEKEIQTGVHYAIPLHRQPAFKKYIHPALCPPYPWAGAEYIASHELSIPIYPELSCSDQDKIISTIKKYYK